MMGPCEHLEVIGVDGPAADPAPDVEPGPDVLCPDCMAEGSSVWAHLRQCLDCGHVACCDSSPYRHAAAHYEASGHPVIRSFEPGESWRWCYVDRRLA